MVVQPYIGPLAPFQFLNPVHSQCGGRGSVVVKATLQAGRSQVRDPMRYFFNLPNPSH
jgi:hypothetical protein